MEIREGVFEEQVVNLLELHVSECRAQTARGSAHALDLRDLQSPDLRFWTLWEAEQVLGCGALKILSSQHGEIKSMHTADSARRRGVASIIIRQIIQCAKEMGLSRLSLETGSWDYFRPARALYASHGFVECLPFGNYLEDPNSVFMSLELMDGSS